MYINLKTPPVIWAINTYGKTRKSLRKSAQMNVFLTLPQRELSVKFVYWLFVESNLLLPFNIFLKSSKTSFKIFIHSLFHSFIFAQLNVLLTLLQWALLVKFLYWLFVESNLHLTPFNMFLKRSKTSFDIYIIYTKVMEIGTYNCYSCLVQMIYSRVSI